MKRVRNSRFLFEQQLKSNFWDWDIKHKKLLDNYSENRAEIYKEIFRRVRTLFLPEEPIEIALIIHDKDVSSNGNLVEPHIHGYLDFPKQIDLKKVALAIGLEPQRIETPKSKGGRNNTKKNNLAYLIHAKDCDKYQYDIDEVETFETFDYREFIDNHKEEFERRAATVKREKLEESLDLVLSKVQRGELTYDEIMRDDNYAFLYANNQQKFREAFNFHAERECYLRLASLKNGEYDLTVIYIHGISGAGKSTLANKIIEMVQFNLNKYGFRGDCYSASSSNPFDNYLGEEILLLDDLRSNSLSASDWLKLLDPINSARMSARYSNKLVVPRLIIITAYMSPLVFFDGIKTEDTNQYLRRIQFTIEMSRNEEMERNYVLCGVKEKFLNGNGDNIYRYEKIYSSVDEEKFLKELIETYVTDRIVTKRKES